MADNKSMLRDPIRHVAAAIAVAAVVAVPTTALAAKETPKEGHTPPGQETKSSTPAATAPGQENKPSASGQENKASAPGQENKASAPGQEKKASSGATAEEKRGHGVATPPAESAPEVGEAVVAGPVAGHVQVRLAGSAHYTTLDASAKLPVGAVIDAEKGSMKVVAELPGGSEQTGTFSGGKFRILQAKSGMTEVRLAGPLSCQPAKGLASAAGKARTSRKLWSKDRSGRFRTRGANSVATARGTEWMVEDRCDGTLTKVTHGAVVVRDSVLRKTVLLRAGDRYLARAKR